MLPHGQAPPATFNFFVPLLRVQSVEERRVAFSLERKALGTSTYQTLSKGDGGFTKKEYSQRRAERASGKGSAIIRPARSAPTPAGARDLGSSRKWLEVTVLPSSV